MKKIALSLIAWGAWMHTGAQVNHQAGTYYYNNPTVPATTFTAGANLSSSFGGTNNIVGSYSLAAGYNSKVNSYASFAHGTHLTSNGPQSQSFGSYIRTDGELSFTFGSGTGSAAPFINPYAKTFAISWDPNNPALAVRNISGQQRVAIGTFNPTNRLHIMTADDQGITFQCTGNNQRSNIEFRDQTANLNWDITAYNNFIGGYGNILEIHSHKDGNVWIHNSTMMIGSAFDFSSCTDCSDYLLFVRRGIRTEKLKVDIASGTWADYVFDPGYKLMPLGEVETFIRENRHLPGIASAVTVEAEGIDVGAMNTKLLEKVEELTLYVIGLEKKIAALEAQSSK
jgi:hypothetical protein